MSRWNVIIVGLAHGSLRAEELARALTAAWPGPNTIRFEIASVDSLDDPQQVNEIDATVLMVPSDVSECDLLRLLSQFEERSIPVLALTARSSDDAEACTLAGALACDADESPSMIVAVLRGLLHRQREIQHLNKELLLGQRFQGGLRGEMARMHDELQLAAVVQRELLPRDVPHVHGVQFAALWRPVNYVSGDIYDVIRLDEDHVGLFLADAVGHGVPAALMTMVLCQSLKPIEIINSTARIRPPAQVLTKLNEAMIQRQAGHARFATAVYGVLNCRSRILTLAGAGHPPPIKLSADGRCVDLQTEGGLLGVFNDGTFDQIEVELEMDDRLLFFSDGFEQAFPAPSGSEYSQRLPTNRYRAEFEELIRLTSAQAMIEQVSRRLDVQKGSLHQADDLTLLCVHAGPLDIQQPGEVATGQFSVAIH